ncbi:hypothetical protein BY996DRAFT_6447696 [Phakopsora pachyrhizi]|nr:hypothetical protein BY996DRAFT_6447696 [Phakopsora pachyrhizi]
MPRLPERCIKPYEDEVDEFDDWVDIWTIMRMTDEMIKEDIEQESLPGSWLRVAAIATTTTREDSISKMIVADVIELILKMIKEEDSFVYLNSIKAFCKLTEKYPGEICDWFDLIYESLKDHSVDIEKAASKLENDNELERARATIVTTKRLPWESWDRRMYPHQRYIKPPRRARVSEEGHSRQVGRNEMVYLNESTPIRHCCLQSGMTLLRITNGTGPRPRLKPATKIMIPKLLGISNPRFIECARMNKLRAITVEEIRSNGLLPNLSIKKSGVKVIRRTIFKPIERAGSLLASEISSKMVKLFQLEPVWTRAEFDRFPSSSSLSSKFIEVSFNRFCLSESSSRKIHFQRSGFKNDGSNLTEIEMIRKLFEMTMVIEPIPTILEASSNIFFLPLRSARCIGQTEESTYGVGGRQEAKHETNAITRPSTGNHVLCAV